MERTWSDVSVRRLLDRAWDSSRMSFGTRVQRARAKLTHVLQCAIAAGLAFFIASSVLHHPSPLFAPIVAVVCLGMSYGQRLRRVAEVTVGVALGVAIADLFVSVVGRGAWQITAVVLVSMLVALFLDAGNLLVTQSAVQSVAVVVLAATPGQAFTRWLDALVGGFCALLLATIVPQAPLRRPRVVAARVVATVADLLDGTADAARRQDVEAVARVLARARDTEGLLGDLGAAASEGMSVVASSPFRRSHRAAVRKVSELVTPMDRAMRSTRVLVRRVAVSLGRGETLPRHYEEAMRGLAEATRVIERALAENASPRVAQPGLLRMADEIAKIERTDSLSTETVLAQMRSVVIDLLQVTGMDLDGAVAALPRERPRS